jgi:hypothetical protein
LILKSRILYLSEVMHKCCPLFAIGATLFQMFKVFSNPLGNLLQGVRGHWQPSWQIPQWILVILQVVLIVRGLQISRVLFSLERLAEGFK